MDSLCVVLNLDIPKDKKEQHIFVEYLINKYYPCIDYSMPSHLSIQEPPHSLAMVNREIVNTTENIMSWIINSEKCPQPCI